MRENLEHERARGKSTGNQFKLKHDRHRIQHSFNSERLEKLSELKNCSTQKDLEKAVFKINKEIMELRQYNKILEIANRHE